MKWKVFIRDRVEKKIPLLPRAVRDRLIALLLEIENCGPVRGNWPNYGKLGRGVHHCHLKKGRPTWVAVWEVKDDKACLVEVIYAGTHEKAPY